MKLKQQPSIQSHAWYATRIPDPSLKEPVRSVVVKGPAIFSNRLMAMVQNSYDKCYNCF